VARDVNNSALSVLRNLVGLFAVALTLRNYGLILYLFACHLFSFLLCFGARFVFPFFQ